jgi:hypothetical protein
MVVKRGKKVVGKTVIQAKIVVSFNTGKKVAVLRMYCSRKQR